MKRLRPWLRAAAAIVRRDVLLFTSYRMQAVSTFASVFVSVATFYYVSRLVRTSQFETPDTYFAYVVVGLVIMQMINATMGVAPSRIRSDLMAGTLERLIVGQIGVLGGILAMLIFPIMLELIAGATTIVFAAAIFGLPIHWETAAFAIPVAVLAAVAFVPFTLLFVASVLAFKQLPPGSTYVVIGLSFVSGIYFPESLLPGFISWTQHVQPFSPCVDLLRHLLSNAPIEGSAWGLVARIVAFTAVLMPVSVWAVNAAVRHGRRRGTLIEY